LIQRPEAKQRGPKEKGGGNREAHSEKKRKIASQFVSVPRRLHSAGKKETSLKGEWEEERKKKEGGDHSG